MSLSIFVIRQNLTADVVIDKATNEIVAVSVALIVAQGQLYRNSVLATWQKTSRTAF
jgi:hypothetical protein